MRQEALSNRVPPNLPEIEQEVLGAILNNNEELNKIADILTLEHFFVPIHQKIYGAIVKLVDRNLVASPLTLKGFLQEDPAFKHDDTDGFTYLVQLAAKADMIVNIRTLVLFLKEASIRRQLIAIGTDIVNEAYEGEVSGEERIESAERQLFNLANSGRTDKDSVPIRDSLLQTLKKIELTRKRGSYSSGVPTGLTDIDKITGGLQNSDLVVLAARPSMGKTSLALNIALNSAMFFKEEAAKAEASQLTENTDKSVLFFSLEMSAEQLANRVLAIRTGLDSSAIRMGKLDAAGFSSLVRESGVIGALPLFIDDTPALSISSLRTRARRMKRQHNIGMVVIDYLQLVRPSLSSAYGNRVQEIGEISQGLKALAKEIDVPVLALSQLSRAVESREDKRPQLSDLRESGSIEQDADVVMFLLRMEYYLSRSVPKDEKANTEWQRKLADVMNLAEVIFAKQRNGPIGAVTLFFNSATTAFSNLEERR